MRLTLISNDIELEKRLEETGYFDQVEICGTIEQFKDADVLVISDKVIGFNELILAHDNQLQGKYKSIYYMLSNVFESNIDNIYQILKVKNINYFPPKLTVEQITEGLIQDFVPGYNKHKNIVTFFGAKDEVGTTMVSQCVAEFLAKHTELKVCLLMLGGEPGMTYVKKREPYGLDSIKTKLFNGILRPSELMDTCTTNDNLYILPGNENYLETRLYSPDYCENLIKIASQEFGAVIINAGSNYDMCGGMMAAALNTTNYKYLVTTQQKSAKDKFEVIDNQVLRRINIDPKECFLVVNKYIESTSLLNPSQIADAYKLYLGWYLPSMEFLGWQAEEDMKSLYSYNDKNFNNQLEKLVKLIASQLEIQLDNVNTERKGIFKFLRGKANVRQQ